MRRDLRDRKVSRDRPDRKVRGDRKVARATPGAAGPPGLSDYSLEVHNSGNSNNVAVKSVQVDCPNGTVPLGGGGEVIPADTLGVLIVSSYPRDNGWFAKAEALTTIRPPWKLATHVACAKVSQG